MSDNKNRYLFMFLSLLTALGIFNTIEVGFLLVGHIHEDIDRTYWHSSHRGSLLASSAPKATISTIQGCRN